MKTSTIIVASIFLSLQINLEGQSENQNPNTSSVKVITVPHDNYVTQLLADASSLNTKAEKLRLLVKSADEVTRKKLLYEASALEIQSLEKQIEAFEINFALNSKLYSDNNKLIKQLEKKSGVKKSGMHIQYLEKESHKNMKLANELAEESNYQDNLALRMGALDNAEEKLLMALKQQNETIELLKEEAKSVAHK